MGKNPPCFGGSDHKPRDQGHSPRGRSRDGMPSSPSRRFWCPWPWSKWPWRRRCTMACRTRIPWRRRGIAGRFHGDVTITDHHFHGDFTFRNWDLSIKNGALNYQRWLSNEQFGFCQETLWYSYDVEIINIHQYTMICIYIYIQWVMGILWRRNIR